MTGVLQHFITAVSVFRECFIFFNYKVKMAIYAFKGNFAKIYIANSTGVSLNAVFDNIYFPVTEFNLIIVVEQIKLPNQKKF